MNEGSKIGHYEIREKIGAGGMGEVYLADDTKLDRKVAIKFLNEDFSKDADKLNRFIQEAKAASALNHPNILTVYEIGEVDGKNYIATELIDGKTLRDHLSRKESLQLNQILKIGVQVSEALSAAHQAGIIHRDIKPENIMIRKDGYAKVLDFGLAKLTEPGGVATGSEDAATTLVNTMPGMVMGTVSYMSPEQARASATDARTDIWSLGVVLYEMLAGKMPFSGETVNHIIVSILEKEPQRLENVPDELQRIVRKSLTKDVYMRYQSAHDMLIDLKNLRRDLDIKGELERSVVPNRETVYGTSSENATRFYTADGEATGSGKAAGTQNITTSSSSLEYAVTQAKSHKVAAAVIGLSLFCVVSAIAYFGFIAKAGAKQIESIAVMPFVNESGNADIEYLSDGMTETLISGLSQIPNFSVKARSSVFRYKGKETDAKTIGKELNVQAILNGRVNQRGDQLTVSLELVDAATENAIWSQQYVRKQSDLVSLQSEIARDVSSKLKSKLSGAETAKVEKNYTANSEAYQLYLKGRYHWNKRETKEFEKAVEFFKQAIEKDPNYALAYTGLADTYALIPNYGDFRSKEYMPQAKQAALKALEIDDNLAEAHASLGQILFYYDFDWAGAEREYKRGIEIDPNYATGHQWYAERLSLAGRHDDAIREISKAVELDPFSMIFNRNLADFLINAGRYDEGLAQNKRFMELFPNLASPYFSNAGVYLTQGKYSEAFEQYMKAWQLSTASPEFTQNAKAAYEKNGWEELNRLLLKDALEETKAKREKDKTAFIPSIGLAFSYAGIKDKEKTLEYLNKAYEERSVGLLFLKVDLPFNFLHDDPQFKELVKKIGIPE